ncbi:unnamed protein product [Vicia faba]|uniref:Uncharacterized protein n=1 Tax=Vicia faba TaxID=3906 RepID=A0AAV0YNS1_VICFA|nr:unnamed protein product [Vicia faba]
MNSKRRCAIKIRMSEEDIVEGEVNEGVIGYFDGFTGEESTTAWCEGCEEDECDDEEMRIVVGVFHGRGRMGEKKRERDICVLGFVFLVLDEGE